jgi:hypothetical protein
MAAVDALDYLLGRNPTGYSYVTGYGAKTPQFPHHRPSSADGITEPVPGLLVGGPNPKQEDKCVYASTLAALSYSDTECSYASNEIAINWNAPFAYLAGGLEASLGAGATGTGIRFGKSGGMNGGKHSVLIGWEAKRLRVRWPQGWKGSVELFDMRGARLDAAAMDTAGGSLWVYRLRAIDPEGRQVLRTGNISPFANLRVELHD